MSLILFEYLSLTSLKSYPCQIIPRDDGFKLAIILTTFSLSVSLSFLFRFNLYNNDKPF